MMSSCPANPVEANEPLYYIQNKGYSGDCLLWWRADCCGYTTNLDEALKVSKVKADHICHTRPDEDFAWPVVEVDAAATRHANSEAQYFRDGLRAMGPAVEKRR